VADKIMCKKSSTSKADLIEAVQEKGFCLTDDNEADSLAINLFINTDVAKIT
jgi:hypothetical protein